MKTRTLFKYLLALLVGLTLMGSAMSIQNGGQATGAVLAAPSQAGMGSGFVYYGQLKTNYTGYCDFKFTLWDAYIAGTQIGGEQSRGRVNVVGGIFMVTLNFGEGVFNGEARWLETQARCPSSPLGRYLNQGRSKLDAVPYALYALNATQDFVWQLAGNGGTIPDTHFLGTTDDTPLEIRVNNTRVLLLQPNATSPNIIGGYSGNTVGAGVYGAFIGGGGGGGAVNTVNGNYGTVCGGAANGATANFATVAGGNRNQANAGFATIGGGYQNTAGYMATVAGGELNTASGDWAAVGGGEHNNASGNIATIGGGDTNTAGGPYSTVGGGVTNAASGQSSTIAGGWHNIATTSLAAICGGMDNTAAYIAAIGGGYSNNASGNYSTIGGGWDNTANGAFSTVPGGTTNIAWADYTFAAGRRAKANHQGSFVWADSTNADFASTAANQFAVRASGGSLFELAPGNFTIHGGARALDVTGTDYGVYAVSGGTAAVLGTSTSPSGVGGYFSNSGGGSALYVGGNASIAGALTLTGPLNGGTPWTTANDGSGSTLDADLLDGQQGIFYQNATNINAGTLGTNYYSAYNDLGAEGYLGNAAGDLALNNGTLQSTLNADLLDGYQASSFAILSHGHWGQIWGGSGAGLQLSGGTLGIFSQGSNWGVYANGGTAVYAGGDNIGIKASGPIAGEFNGTVNIAGNLYVSGSKSAVVKTKDYGTRALYTVESPENWFEDFGTGQLTDGIATVSIEPVFAQTVNLTEDYHVFLTPLGDCMLYVAEKTETSFTVRAAGGQTCNVAFDYRIVAKRLGYEDVRLEEVTIPEPPVPPEAPSVP